MKIKLFFLAWILIGASHILIAQEKYFVAFTDKEGTPFTIDKPNDFLSEKAITRRSKQGIAVKETDLPVSPTYISEIQQLGAKVFYPLKWFNGVVVETYSNEMVNSILNKPFVTEVSMVFDPTSKGVPLPDDEIFPVFRGKSSANDYYDYGSSANQVKIMNGHKLHNLGFRGKGMTIAVLDAGFLNANVLPALDSVFQNGQIIHIKDFVNPHSNVFQEHSHGTIVLSAMAGNFPGQLIGTAPEANYILIRSEDTSSEQIIEEYNWAAAAELADSLGADIINSSLGYYVFDAGWQNHTYANMDGETTPCARAANFVRETGILVVASAGNEGNNEWGNIITPSDAFGSIAVGAVDGIGNYVGFSSRGPSADGRVKPDVAAVGLGTVIQSANGGIGTANGTSLSAPLISGMLACLWQALPDNTAEDIYKFLIRSGSQYQSPNHTLGYGIPDFEIALNHINQEPNGVYRLNLFPNPTNNQITFYIPWEGFSEFNLSLIDIYGRSVLERKVTSTSSYYTLHFPQNMSSGTYLLRLNKGEDTLIGRFIKSNL